MADILMTIFGDRSLCSSLCCNQLHILLFEEKLQKAKEKWNEDRMKQLGFINRSLRQKNESKAYIKNVDKAIVKYYQAFSKGIKP